MLESPANSRTKRSGTDIQNANFIDAALHARSRDVQLSGTVSLLNPTEEKKKAVPFSALRAHSAAVCKIFPEKSGRVARARSNLPKRKGYIRRSFLPPPVLIRLQPNLLSDSNDESLSWTSSHVIENERGAGRRVLSLVAEP